MKQREILERQRSRDKEAEKKKLQEKERKRVEKLQQSEQKKRKKLLLLEEKKQANKPRKKRSPSQSQLLEEEKKKQEGKPSVKTCLWGIDSNTETLQAGMPEPKMQKFYHLVNLAQFSWGCYRVRRADAQALRGMGTHISVVLPQIVTELAGVDWRLRGPNQSSVLVDPSGDSEESQNK